MELFQGRLLQAEGIQHHSALFRVPHQEIGEHQGQDDKHQSQPLLGHKIGNDDHTLGNAGQIRAHFRKGGNKHRHGLDHDDDEHHDCHKNHDGRIGQGTDDLAPDLRLLIKVFFQALKADFQGAGGLARPDGFNKGHGQIGGIVFKALGQGVAAGHILGNLQEHCPELRGAGLLAHHLHAPDNGQAGGEDDGKLGAHNGKVFVPDLGRAQVDIQAQALLDLLDAGNHGARFPKHGNGLVLIIGLYHTGDLLSVRRQALIFKCGHWVIPAFR